MPDQSTEPSESISNAKRLILLVRLRLVLATVLVGLAAIAVASMGLRLHSRMGGRSDAAYFLLSLLVLMVLGAWLRNRHGYKIFWLTFLAAALAVWAWAALPL